MEQEKQIEEMLNDLFEFEFGVNKLVLVDFLNGYTIDELAEYLTEKGWEKAGVNKPYPKTNFDRITESVESLARYIENYTMFWWKKCDQCETYDHCNECIKEWLQKECEE
jgi:hypothetical protein